MNDSLNIFIVSQRCTEIAKSLTLARVIFGVSKRKLGIFPRLLCTSPRKISAFPGCPPDFKVLTSLPESLRASLEGLTSSWFSSPLCRWGNRAREAKGLTYALRLDCFKGSSCCKSMCRLILALLICGVAGVSRVLDEAWRKAIVIIKRKLLWGVFWKVLHNLKLF